MEAINILKEFRDSDITFKKMCEISNAIEEISNYVSNHQAVERMLDKKIKDLEDFQNRSCNNCIHYKESSTQNYKTCYEIKVSGFNLESDKDFCCNRWE